MYINRILLFTLFFCFNNVLFSQQKTIRVYSERNKKDKNVSFYYEKTKPGSYYLSVKFSELENTHTSDFHGVVKRPSGFLFKMRALDKTESIKYAYSYSWIKGVPNPKLDSTFIYSLPFKKGNEAYVYEQGYVKETYFGNKRPDSWRSYSFRTKTTDTICSIRKGIVIDIVNKYEKDSLKKAFSTQRNRLIIEHEDGTIAYYKNLVKNSFLVKLGQTVYPQTPLGIMHKSKNEMYYFSLIVSYLANKDYDEIISRSFTKGKSINKFITPFFYASSGSFQLQEKTKYIVEFDKSILTKEFTKKELKKYKKHPELFN